MATYYVKNGGNDSLDGSSDGNAWATIVKIRATALTPGDSVLFKRGNTWKCTLNNASESLVLNTYSGTEGNPITYGAYDNGNRPIITSRIPFTAWNTAGTWTNVSGNIWSASGFTCAWALGQNSRGRIWLNGVEVMKVQDNVNWTPDVTHPWTHNTSTLYLYATSNPATYYSLVEFTGHSGYSLYISKDYLTIQNINFGGGETTAQIVGGNHIIIENCDIGADTAMNGLTTTYSDDLIIRNNTFATLDTIMDVYSRNNTEEGFAPNDGTTNCEVYGNTFTDWSHCSFLPQVNVPAISITHRSRTNNVATITYSSINTRITTGKKVTIGGMTDTSYNGVFTILSTPTTTSITYSNTGSNEGSMVDVGGSVGIHDPIVNMKFHDNISSGANCDYTRAFGWNIRGDLVGECTECEVYNNYFYNHKVHSQISGDGLKFYNNIIDGVFGASYSPYQDVGVGLDIACYYGWAKNNEVYNNIFMNCKNAGVMLPFSGNTTMGGFYCDYRDNLIVNNIFYNNGHNSLDVRWSPGADFGNTYKNNLFYDATYTDVIYIEKMVSTGDRHRTVTTHNNMNGSVVGMFSAADAPYYIQENADVTGGNIFGNPLFVDTDNANYLLRNYSLQGGSPAIGIGMDVGLTTDYAGNLWNATPSIGAYEYVPTTYYVKNSGNDSLDGKSDANAWATIAKVNSSSFNGGEQILFNKGDMWREMLVVPSSGTSGHYIVFTSYGTGNKPQILGWNQVAIWTEQGTANIWQAPVTTNPLLASSGNVCFKTANTLNIGMYKTSIGALVSEYDWFWASNVLYVYAASDPDSRYTIVEVSARYDCMRLNGKSYIEINGIDFFGSQIDGIWQDDNGAFSDLIVRNCEIAYIGYIGHIGEPDNLGYGIEAVVTNTLFENLTIHHCGRRGLSLVHYGTDNRTNITVQNCVFYAGYHTTGCDVATGSTPGDTGDISNLIIRNNLFYEDENKITNSTAFIQIIAGIASTGVINNVYIYNNLFKYTDGTAITSYFDTDELHIYNNTFYGVTKNKTGEITFVKLDNVYTGRKTYIKNNIFYNDAVYATADYAESIGLYYTSNNTYSRKEDVTSDYNLYYNTDASTYIVQSWYNPHALYTMSQWATMKSAMGWETNSPTPANPLFTSPSDYHLQEGSPARGAGIAVGLNTDYAGNLWNTPPSIGAYEYGSSLSLTEGTWLANRTTLNEMFQNLYNRTGH